MNPFRLRMPVLALVLAAGSAVAFAAAPVTSVPIFNAKTGLTAGWSAVVWGDITFEPSKTVSKDTGGVSLLITPTAIAQPYAGLQIVAAPGAGIPLTDALRAGGEVVLLLRNGNDGAGNPAADQDLQVMLAFRPESGPALNGQYEQLTLRAVPAGGKGTAGWQSVRLSVARQIQGRVPASTPLKLHGVYVQYVGQPAAAYHVGECLLVNPPAK